MPVRLGSSPEPSPWGGCVGSGLSSGKRRGACATGSVSVAVAGAGAHGSKNEIVSEISFGFTFSHYKETPLTIPNLPNELRLHRSQMISHQNWQNGSPAFSACFPDLSVL